MKRLTRVLRPVAGSRHSRVGEALTGVLVATFLLAACGGGGGDGSAASDQRRFCQLARERDALQPDLDFEKATPAEVRAALGTFIERAQKNVDEARRIAPEEIRADFEGAVVATRRAAESGDLSEFEKPEVQRVGSYIEKNCPA